MPKGAFLKIKWKKRSYLIFVNMKFLNLGVFFFP